MGLRRQDMLLQWLLRQLIIPYAKPKAWQGIAG